MVKRVSNRELQATVRGYLKRLSNVAKKYGLMPWLEDIICQNKNGECEATLKEADMLSRMVDDDRIALHDIPSLLRVSYRKMLESNVLMGIRKLPHKGNYSKLDALNLRKAMSGKEVRNG